MHKRLLPREYSVLIVIGLLMGSMIVSNRVTSYKSRKLLRQACSEYRHEVGVKKTH